MRVQSVIVFVMVMAAMGAMAFAQVEDSAKAAQVEDSTKAAPAEEVSASALTAEVQLCTAVEERVPTGAGDSFGSDIGQLCLWSKISGAVDTTFIRHVWYFQGEEKATVELPVRSPSFRTWSRKTILPEWIGEWEVKVLDADGNLLSTTPFTIFKEKVEKQ